MAAGELLMDPGMISFRKATHESRHPPSPRILQLPDARIQTWASTILRANSSPPRAPSTPPHVATHTTPERMDGRG